MMLDFCNVAALATFVGAGRMRRMKRRRREHCEEDEEEDKEEATYGCLRHYFFVVAKLTFRNY